MRIRASLRRFFWSVDGLWIVEKVVPKEDTDLGWVPEKKTKKKKGKSVTIVAAT